MSDADSLEPMLGFNAETGFRLVDWSDGAAVLALDLAARHLNRSGVVHGGVLAAMLDVAMGYSGVYPVDGAPRWSVTLSLTTSFIGQARAGRLTARGRRIGGGRQIYFAEGEVRDAEGALLAAGQATFRLRNSAPPGVVEAVDSSAA